MKIVILALCCIFLISPFTAMAGGQDEGGSSGTRASGGDGDALTVLNDRGITGEFPNQFELDEFESLTGAALEFAGNPKFSGSARERLPEEPLILAPYERIGAYGGTIRGLSRAPESGTSGMLSWRHVNFVRFADDFKTVVPDIAKGWEWNASKTKLTFFLRRGHKWSDGEPFTSEDVLFWWEDIQKNTDLNEAVSATWTFGGEPMEVSAPDPYTVEFSFAAPSPGALLTFATRYIQPFQPKHVLRAFHPSYNRNAEAEARELGYDDWQALFAVYYHDWKDSYHPLSGRRPIPVPTLESHILSDETTEYRRLEANPYYHAADTAGNQLPYIDEFYEIFIQDAELATLRVMSGDIDFKAQGMNLADYPVLKDNEELGNYRVNLAPTGTASMVMLGLNVNHKNPAMREVLGDVRFREAMSLAIDREEINEVVYLGQGTPMQVTPGDSETVDFISDAMLNHMIDYSPERAMRLLDEMGLEKDRAGFRLRPDGEPLILLLQYTTQGSPAALMQLVKEYWDAVGVKTELKEVNSDLYWNAARENDHDMGIWMANGNNPPALYSDPPFTPPFADAMVGSSWANWVWTEGEEGIEPPEYIETLFELTEEFRSQEFGSDRYNELGARMAQIHVDNLLRIGTVGNVGRPVVVHDRLKNVPEILFSSYDYYYAYPLRTAQWFIEE